MERHNKEDQIEVIKFLKSPEYTKVLKKYNNKFDTKMNKFQEKYESESSNYKSNEAEYSEIAMHSIRAKLLKEKIKDIKGDSRGADLLREIIGREIIGVQSHLYNSVTNSIGMSKDVAVYTEDDMEKYKMLHEKDFHLFIINLMNPSEEGLSMQERYEIYENPEEQL